MTPQTINLATQFLNKNFQTQQFHPQKAHINMVGWTPSLEPPRFPRDDKNVSPRKTPESVNTRPCWHCRSRKHWDYECQHSRKGERQVWVNFVTLSDLEIDALSAYDDLYYRLEFNDKSAEDQQNFHEPLPVKSEDKSSLEGSQEPVATLVPMHSKSSVQGPSLHLGQDLTNTKKFPLNRATWRNLARNISRVYHTVSNQTGLKEPLIELHKYMARPPRCSFLGASAAHVPVNINLVTDNHSDIIVDSGSNITLISMKTLNTLLEIPKIKKDQKINLVQVTGKSSISRYVNLDLYFHTPEGLIKIKVEAYVIKGMTTPLILGNDFADQYSLAVNRLEGRTFLEFGDSRRSLNIVNSISPEQVDEGGHTFKVWRISLTNKGFLKKINHQRNQWIKHKSKFQASNQNVRSKVKVVIPPETCVTVPVLANFPEKSEFLYVKKIFDSNWNLEDIYIAPDSSIKRERPVLQVSNFSLAAITIQGGQTLGKARNPDNWLDRPSKYSGEESLQQVEVHVQLIRKLASDWTPNPKFGVLVPASATTATSQTPAALQPLPTYFTKEDPLAEGHLEGGLKIYEVGEETISNTQLLRNWTLIPNSLWKNSDV